MSGPATVLVIKLSALGDFVQALGLFAAIRAHHPEARIILLTTAPFVEFVSRSPYFDDVWVDARPRPWDVAGVIRLRKLLRAVRFTMVYDLQTSDRSASYFHLMGKPPWSGIVPGSAYRHANPHRNAQHTLDRQADQLAVAGIPTPAPPDLSWVNADVDRFTLPARFVLLVPGGASHRPGKQWPAARYIELADTLSEPRLPAVLVGAGRDDAQIDAIRAGSRRVISLADQTSLADIVGLARRAVAAVGNDTGPMHLIAAAGCPAIVLFSADSDPALCAPRGKVTVIQREDLATLAADPVMAALPRGSVLRAV